MEDKEIIALYWARSEEAIRETVIKYGAYCRSIIRRILGDGRDGEECLNDTWLGAWNAIPPQRPNKFSIFLGRIARNTALDRYAYNTAQCRDYRFEQVLEELSDCVSGNPAEETLDFQQLGECISLYLEQVSASTRQMFLRRYWYCETPAEIAKMMHCTSGKVRSQLHRTRQGLREYLTQEGYLL